MRNVRVAWAFTVVAFGALAASAFAQVKPNQPVRFPVIGGRIAAPTMAPASSNLSRNAVAGGTSVPLSRLAALPLQTKLNTVTPKSLKMRVRPMSASGATIDVNTNTNCGGGGALGDQFNVGCTVGWRATGLIGAHTWQDYAIVTTNGNHAAAVAQGGTYTGAAGSVHTTTMNVPGTYIFGVYDTTAAQWIAVVYVNAGQVSAIRVYQDAFHTQETYQFDAGTSSSAYVYLPNVSQSDFYVVGIEQTSVAPNCVFMGPAPLPSPYPYPANRLCNLTASSGVQAPGGNLSVKWPIGPSLSAGIYSVVVWDITSGTLIGQVQVSVTGASGLVLITKPDASGANANPSPRPIPGATASTIFDWDGGGGLLDESVTGFNASIQGASNGNNYRFTLSDPQGQVISSAAATVASNTANQTFTFDTIASMLPPGQYPAQSFTVQLYDTTHNNVIASQGFKVLGYASLTQFNTAGTLSTTLAIAPGNKVVSGLTLTNTGNGIFNQFGDSLQKIVVSTGPNFNANTTGNGIMASVVNGATTPCLNCSTTTVDSAGNTWNVNVTCSAAAPQTNGECNIEFDPANASTSLAPDAYISLTNVTFFSATGATCGNSCQAVTSELPLHGLTWSRTSTALSWQPVYFRNAASAESGTSQFRLIGSIKQGTKNNLAGPPFTGPFVGTHYFQAGSPTFMQGDYNDNSPYSVSVSANTNTSHDDIAAFTIKNTGADQISGIAIALPPLFLFQGYYGVDSLSAGWTQGTFGNANGCPTTYGAQWICFNGTINSGSTATIYIDLALSLQSFPFQDMQVQAYANNQWFSTTPAAGAIVTPDGRNTLDNLAFGLFSLNGSNMSAYFNPGTVGAGSTATLGAVVQNTSTSADPNPDSLDLVVLEAPSTGLVLSSVPTVSPAGWSYLGQFKKNGATTTQYWFGVCSNQFNAASNGSYGGPPTANGAAGYPLASVYPSPGPCTAAQESNAVAAGQKVTISNMQLTNFATGNETWFMHAHGANAGGWSQKQSFGLLVTPESASTWFNAINGAPTTQNSVPTIGGSPNTYQYAVKNTSQSSNIGTVVVTVPGLDTNNQNATDSSGNTWNITNIASGGVTLTFPGGQSDGIGGCTVDTAPSKTFNPTTGGTNGEITLDNCTSFKPGDTIYVNFAAQNPQTQGDTYAFPATADGNATGAAWLGGNEIQVQFSIGLDLVVDPSNPGPGGSTPVVNCGNPCAFSGTTADFGNIANGQSFQFQDVVRASVVYTGATSPGHSLLLQVSANQNPAAAGAPFSNEMQSEVDSGRSISGAGVTYNQTSYAIVPTGGGLLMATVPETNRATPYDLLQNFQITLGTESITSHIITITYTVIPT
ncbi:MAG: hypothetical protein M3R51_01450 [Candidatus Eremiobacteraeota bacterium]|nr:hypothetical protein [Candidatus Eremiobacteraeota bacterium]